MPRLIKSKKPLIYIFCEGESEQVYADFLKNRFSNVAVIKRPRETGLFEEAKDKFAKDKRYKNNAEVIDEVWFFFDVEKNQVEKWDARLKIIKNIRKLRKNPGIKVRLLMTTACIEYWLMLHYKMYNPHIESVADKERVLKELKKEEPHYKKGDYDSTAKIAEQYPIAVKNAEKIVKNLLQDGLPGLDDTDERNEWLYKNCKTFSTAFEAIQYLEAL